MMSVFVFSRTGKILNTKPIWFNNKQWLMPSPRLLKFHLPAHLLPPSIFAKKAKIVYVARNPKDLAVSFYNFHKYIPFLPKYDSWDQFFDDYMTGKGDRICFYSFLIYFNITKSCRNYLMLVSVQTVNKNTIAGGSLFIKLVRLLHVGHCQTDTHYTLN